MELNNLYTITDKENIYVINFKMKNKALIEQIDDKYYIAMNYQDIENSKEEKEILAEELGHYYYDAFYTSQSDSILISKQEYRAKKWAYCVLVPLKKLKAAISNGIDDLYSLADFFDVTVNYMYDTINFYINKYGTI